MSAKKKVISVALAASLAAIAIVGSSLAYFTDSAEKDNVFSIGNVKIELTEPNWDKTGKEEAKGMYPGEAVAKDPTVTNVGENPAFVRVKVEWPKGVDMGYRTNYVNGALGENWELRPEDGYFYYHGVLEPGAETDALFDQVVLSTATENDEIMKDYHINVTAEAIQAQGAAVQWDRVKDMEVDEIADWFVNQKQIDYDPGYAK